jgi:hypothetical protein
MKKKLAMALALTCAIVMTACGGSSAPAETAAPAPTVESTVDEPAPVVDESVVEAADPSGDLYIMEYDEYMTAEVDDPVCLDVYVQAKQAWWDNKATIYAQCSEEGGGVFIYEMPISEEDYEALVPGTKIRVNGFKKIWPEVDGEVEIVDAEYSVLDEEPQVFEAIDATEFLGTDTLVDYQNCYVSFKDMTVEATKDAEGNEAAYIYNWDGSGTDGDDLYFNVSKDGTTYTFTVESYLTGAGTDVYEAVKALEVGQTVDLEGFLYWYEGANPHITSVTVK